jgi:beta propeller repeat protein
MIKNNGRNILALILLATIILSISAMADVTPLVGTGTLPGIHTLITTGTPDSDQQNPAISGDRIVWEDNRNGNWDIYLYSVTTGVEQQITSDSSDQLMPSISGEIIVWQDYRNGDADIFLYNTTTKKETRITTNSSDQIAPDVDADRIIWMDHRNGTAQVYIYNITSSHENPVTSDPWFHGSPSIQGEWIVWVDYRNGDADIYLYNTGTGNETRITNTSGQYLYPSVNGDYVIWEDDTSGTSDIHLYQISTGREIPILIDIADASPMYPAISGNRIVWQDSRNMGYSNIFVYEINTSQLWEVTNETYINQLPFISGDRIIWVATPTMYSDINMFTMGALGTCPAANFMESITLGSNPLTVQFNDTSSGTPAHRTWDFGDGNISREQNPVHVYTTNGSYTVSLTVDTTACRDMVTKQNLISVGGSPIPRFTANPTGGPFPLTVQFTDASDGTPDTWLWNFGDNQTAEAQNPVHTYDVPGVYNVSLMAGNIFGNSTVTHPGFITVVSGTMNEIFFEVHGLTVTTNGTSQVITCNTSQANCTFDPVNNTVLRISGTAGSTMEDMTLFSDEGTGFNREGNDTIQGNLTGLKVQSTALYPEGFSEETGKNCSVRFSLDLTGYPESGKITSVLWEGVTPADYQKLLEVVDPNPNFAGITDVAYTARFDKENISMAGPAMILMSVNTTWVREHSQQYLVPTDFDTDPTGAECSIDGIFIGYTPITIPLSTGSHLIELHKAGYDYQQATINVTSDSMRIIRIGEDGVSSILNTTLLGSDPRTGLDYYQAYSPDGLSTFAIAGLHRHGNPFQLFALFWTAHFGNSGSAGGGGYTSGSSGGGGGSSFTSSIVTTTQPPLTNAVETPVGSSVHEVITASITPAPQNTPGEPHTSGTLEVPPTSDADHPPAPGFWRTPLGIISGMIAWVGELTRGRFIFIFAAVAITVVSVIAIWRRGYFGRD